MSTFVILSEDREFWTGIGWAKEYPDARLFTTVHQAKQDVPDAAKTRGLAIVKDYGFEAERVMYRAPLIGSEEAQ